MSSNTINSKPITVNDKKESQKEILRLRIILLFYDEKKGEKIDDDDIYITQFGDIYANANFKISEEEKIPTETVEDERICIPEKLSGIKKKDKQILKKYLTNIENIIERHYITHKYEEIFLDILIPSDNELGIISSIFVLNLFDKNFIKAVKKQINIKKSSISILHENNRLQEDIDEFGSIDNKPNDIDAKIAALMSHYVYFYLDWLEYVYVHKKYKKYCYKENLLTEDLTDKIEKEIEKEFEIDKNILVGGATGILAPGGEHLPGGELKVKVRIVNRLREIAKIVNNTSEDSLNFGCRKTIINVLHESRKGGKPVGFYDLYDKFGYWENYLKDDTLKNEAKKWYVSHPYLVFKNDYEKIYNHNIVKDTNPGLIPDINIINDDSIEAYNKFLAIIPRKTQNIYIYKNKYEYNADYNKWIATGDYLIYNTVLTHGMDQISGYGGLLFTKVELDINKKILKPLKFAYCTKGTDVNSFNDWVFVDLLQGVSGFSLQHVHNVKNAITINEKINDLSKKLEREIPLFFCGHSLGGGLASAGAIASKGRHAITFNAAGLNFLGVIATRTVGGFNYSFKTPDMVHPIRIDGEAVDWLMVYSRLLTGLLNERAYGRPELIFKLKDSDKWDTSEKGPKHGINNFLYKPLMNALEIVSKKTIKQPLGKDTSIATLGLDNAVFQKHEVKRTDIEKGNYIITFEDVNLSTKFVSVCKLNLEECLELFVNLDKNVTTFLFENFDYQCPQ